MLRLLKQLLGSERGQALAIVLAMLAIGGLTIAVSLNYATTNLKGSQILGEDIKGVYAAGAGVEHALWSLSGNGTSSTQLPENINLMAVNMQTVETGNYTLYLGELIEPGQHNDYLAVSGNLTWVEGETYKYVITVTWQPDSGTPVIKLEEVGARIPVDYSYQLESSANFTENLSTDDPEETLDGIGAYLLNWELGTPRPSVSENETVRTQTFYITGTGSQEGHYAWLVASRGDIGAVGEITGTQYKITATATRPEDGRTTARIVADIMIEGETIHIISWQISN